MVVAEDAAPAGEGVLVRVRACVVAEGAQVVGEVVGRGEGVGVVLAEDAAVAGEGVFVDDAGLFVLADVAQACGEVVGGGEGVGVVVAEDPAVARSRVSVRRSWAC